MTDDTTTQRQYLYAALTKKFSGLAMWRRIEPDLAVLTSDIPEPTTPEMTDQLINAVKMVQDYLLEQGIPKEDLTFLDEEMERHRHTKQISLYEEKDDYVDAETLNRFCHLSYTREGITGIDKPYNYGQLRRITNAVYQKTGNIKFFISEETISHGQIAAEVFDFVQEVPIARLVIPNNEDNPSFIALFGDNVDKKKAKQIREITAPFHVYIFVDRHAREFMLLSVDKLELGNYEIRGTMVKVGDPKKLSESSRLPTKLPFIFLKEAIGTVARYKNHGEFTIALNKLHLHRADLFNYPFVFSMRNKKYEAMGGPTHINVVGKHPKWFKWLIWAWLTHAPQGMGEQWPLPLLIVGPPNAGKTFLLERLSKISIESQPIFKGEDSSIKGTVPSFHSTPPKRGYLCDCQRFAFMDEFFRCISSVNDADERRESLARLNSLLEHKVCAFSSGKGSVKVQMRARAIFTNNPPRGARGVDDILTTYDKAFLTRTLIYWQKENGDHAQMIRQCKVDSLKTYTCPLKEEDFISFIDYLWTFSSTWDEQRLNEIYRGPIPLLTEVQRNHYESRHKHHLECIMDGIIKTRNLLEGISRFVAVEEDYAMLELIWSSIIRDWVDADMIRSLPLRSRAHFLPESSQWLWNKLRKENRPISRGEVEAMALTGMTRGEFYTAYTILRTNKLVDDDYGDGNIRPYYLVPGYSEEEPIKVAERTWSDEE